MSNDLDKIKKYTLIPNQCAHSGTSLTTVLAVINVIIFHLLELIHEHNLTYTHSVVHCFLMSRTCLTSFNFSTVSEKEN